MKLSAAASNASSVYTSDAGFMYSATAMTAPAAAETESLDDDRGAQSCAERVTDVPQALLG